ncbi:MAG: hypothetical protein O3C59_10600, partial [Proteobacteria bacterium]|nr:hypothetical protein [Pseudomonadota bacterium]
PSVDAGSLPDNAKSGRFFRRSLKIFTRPSLLMILRRLNHFFLKIRTNRNAIPKIIVKYVSPEHTHLVMTKYEESFAMYGVMVPLIKYCSTKYPME